MLIIRHTDPTFKDQINRFQARVGDFEAADSALARERTKKTFGRELSPSEVVRLIIDDVRQRGDAALFDYALRLDGATLTPDTLFVSDAEIKAAYNRTDAKLIAAIETAAGRIRAYQTRILPTDAPLAGDDGIELGLRYTPVDRAGIYVPGGLAAYPSSVLHSVIPAQVAGVPSIAVFTPTTRDSVHPAGRLSDAMLAACKICGIKEVVRVGGAQAIAAMAYGTASVRKVDFIAGPGNLFILLAKKEVFGRVNIDMLAGPSEIMILADETADPAFIAADLLSQAEHDPMASALLATTSETLAAAVAVEVETQLNALPRQSIARDSLNNYGAIIVCNSMDDVIALANDVGPEHCEIIARDSDAIARRVRHAGALFIGPYTPEALGDYVAGPSHTLPTCGTARFFSGLSCRSFLKSSSLIRATRSGLLALSDATETFAASESLSAHERSAKIRRERELNR